MSTTPHPAESTPQTKASLAAGEIFKGKEIFVIGGTGFLGKLWLSLLLHRYPEIGHIYLVVRPKDGQDSELRLYSEILPSPVFDPLRARFPGEALHALFREKITPLPGNIQEKFLGIPPEILARMKGRVAAVVNVAGLVDFNPPLDEALDTNAFGIQNIVGVAKLLGDLPVFHTSTCYVAGSRAGLIPEEDPRLTPFPRADELERSHWSPEREIAECVDLVTSARHRCEDAFRQSAFLDEAKQELKSAGEPTRGPALEDKLKQVKRRFIRKQLSGAGIERANFWGWPNTYTYTKSIGEQILVQSGLRVCICRPSVIETSVEYPFPGWNEGINTSTPIIMISMRGHVQIPTRPEQTLDFIPVDMVASGMIAALAALLAGEEKLVYQLASSDLNPCTMHRMIELVGLAKRKRYLAGRGNPLVDYIQARIEPVPVSKETYERQGAGAISRYAKGFSGFLRKAAVGPMEGPLKAASRALDTYSKLAGVSEEIFDVFMPFIHDNNYEFRCDNTRALFASLAPEDQKKLFWYPEKIDWREYFLDIHIPGLEKWVEEKVEAKFRHEEKPIRRHENLWAMLEELTERHDLAPALQRVEGDELWRLSYRDLHDQAKACAARLYEAGITPNDRVVLSAKNHPYWAIAYFGILRAGATVVPVDPELEPAALANIIEASRAKVAIFDGYVAGRAGDERPFGPGKREEGRGKRGKAAEGKRQEAEFSKGFPGADKREDPARSGPLPSPLSPLPSSLTVMRLAAAVAPGGEEVPRVVLEPDDVASLIFTSGTTGKPKGVMLTHKNFTALLSSLSPVFPLGTGDNALSVLPLHHTFEFTCGLLLPLSRGARVTYLDELNGERLTAALKIGKITAMVAVPALWQLLERRISAEVAEKGAVAKMVFHLATSLNRAVGEKMGLNVGRVLFGPVHQALGGNLRHLVSGGAALPEETHKLFAGVGLNLAEGYGLTEAAPVLTVAKASPKARPGHVGKPVPGVAVKIDSPDANGIGEILARGDNVMAGYADDDAATRSVLTEDGWLKTGDLGKIDRHGRLSIVGRAKEVIVSANGENVYPDDIEASLGAPRYIKELSILGIPAPRGGERVACLAVPEADESIDRQTRLSRAEESLRKALRELPGAMRPQVVQLYEADLPRTATRKVKRKDCQKILERILAAAEAPQEEGSAARQSSEVRRAVASVAGVSSEKISAKSHLSDDLGFDSLMRAELVAALDALAKNAGLPPVESERILQAEAVAEVEAAFRTRREPKESRTRQILDEEEKPIVLPEPVKESAKSFMREIQMGFYQKVMRTKVYGRSHIPQNRHALVVSNHCSHLDLGAVKYALGPYGKDLVTVAAKDYFFDANRWRRAYFENLTNVVPLDRQAGGKQSLESASRALGEGKTLLLFPEGTRSTTGLLADFKPGVGYLALEHRVDILPVHVSGSYESFPKGRVLPTKRDLAVRIGPPLDNDTLRRKVRALRPDEAARLLALCAQRAVEALRDGRAFDLSAFDPKKEEKPKEHPMEALFGYLRGRFVPGAVKEPVRFYFSLGEESIYKWSVTVEPDGCQVRNGKPEGGTADCVLKTSPAMMEKIIRQAYVPDPSEFISGAIKTNDLDLLQRFVQIFALS